ncbi:methyltransferase [Gordonia phage Dorito]|uniref:Methyltransferase n=1 Tax=Gordonia phage Dorito TaxID=2499023 RepID=A0A3S9UAM3_9CAUD|nr:methyltransferase [Gordonia phage Dorito]AZS07323.1 methyltransferase [Gordonia phage Dorito]
MIVYEKPAEYRGTIEVYLAPPPWPYDKILSIRFLPGRMRFTRPDWTPGPKGDRPPFGCCLLIWSADYLVPAVNGGDL